MPETSSAHTYDTILKTGDATSARIRSARDGGRMRNFSFSPPPSIPSTFPRCFISSATPPEQQKSSRRKTNDLSHIASNGRGNLMDVIKLESRENASNLESRVEELEKALSTLACLSSLSCLASLGEPIQPQWGQVTDHSRRDPIPIDRSSMNHWPATVWAPSRPLDLKLTQKPKYITDTWPASSQESETDLKPVDPYTLKHISQERMSRQHPPREIQTRHPVLLEIDLMEEQAKALMMASKKG